MCAGARGSSAISCPRIEKSATLGGVRRPVFDRCSLFGSSSVRQSPLPVPGECLGFRVRYLKGKLLVKKRWHFVFSRSVCW